MDIGEVGRRLDGEAIESMYCSREMMNEEHDFMHYFRGVFVAVSLCTLVFSGLIAAGCGSDEASKQAGEKAAEKILESAGEGDVDVDVDGDEVTVKGKDGEFSTGNELPKGWPDDIPLPDDATITSGAASKADSGGTSFFVAASTSMNAKDAVAFYVQELKGYTKQNEFMSGENATVMFRGPAGDVTITTGPDGKKNMLGITITPTEG
jgi:hypothetical protein